MKEKLKDKKEWGIEDAIKHLQEEVDTLEANVKNMEPRWYALRDKWISLSVGLRNLKELQKSELKRREAEA